MLHHLLFQQATRSPERVAVVCRSERLSYGQLAGAALHLATVMRRHGTERGDRVALYLPKSPLGIAAMSAASLLGAAYVPIDPAAPPDYARAILKDCGARLLVTVAALTGLFAGVAPCHAVDTDPALVSGTPPGGAADVAPPPSPAGEQDPAYIIYTSGTTGRPKGVVISHAAAWAYVDWLADEIGLGVDDVLLNTAPFHFDLSAFDIGAALSRGATLVLADNERLLPSAARMAEVIVAESVSVIYAVPSTLRLLTADTAATQALWNGVRAILFGGEVFPIPALRRLMATTRPGTRYINLYGPTETNGCLYHSLARIPEPESRAIPIGRPAAGARVFRDAARRPFAAGETGELNVDTPCLMLGYWREGGIEPVPRPYPTGDLVRCAEDGSFEFLGRRDLMLKVNGYRIEPEGVEAVLGAHPQIAEVAVTQRDGMLAALVVGRDGGPSPLDVKQCCAAALPPYMVPHRVIFVAALPKRSNGKLDREGLANITEAPRSPAEPAGEIQ